MDVQLSCFYLGLLQIMLLQEFLHLPLDLLASDICSVSGSGVAGSWDVCVLSFGRFIVSEIIVKWFHQLYTFMRNIWELPYLQPTFRFERLKFLPIWWPCGFHFHFPTELIPFHTLTGTQAFLLCEVTIQLLPIFLINLYEFLIYFRYYPLCILYGKYFLPFCGLFFHSLWCLLMNGILKF